VKTFTENVLTGEKSSHLYQLKASAAKAARALRDPNYDGVDIATSKDEFSKLSADRREFVQEAIRSGKLVDRVGDGSPTSNGEIYAATKQELTRRYNLESISDLDRFKSDVLIAASIGLVIRTSVQCARTAVVQKKTNARALVSTFVIEGSKGAFQSGGRVALARGMQYLAVKIVPSSVGQWAGRTFGAASSLVFNTGGDLVQFAGGRITGKQVGLNLAKNSTIAVATALSGPLGLVVSAGFMAGEALAVQVKVNNEAYQVAVSETIEVNRDEDTHLSDAKAAIRRIQNELHRRAAEQKIRRETNRVRQSRAMNTLSVLANS